MHGMLGQQQTGHFPNRYAPTDLDCHSHNVEQKPVWRGVPCVAYTYARYDGKAHIVAIIITTSVCRCMLVKHAQAYAGTAKMDAVL